MKGGKTLVIGASTNPERYSYRAVHALRNHHYDVIALGKQTGMVSDVFIETKFSVNEDVHTVTIYIGARHQPEYYQALSRLKPARVIFNPGTENPELADILKTNGVEVVEDCTLVMLNSGRY